VPDVEQELDVLFGTPLAQFTSGRTDLSKRLRKAGNRDAAEEVAGLRKPPVSAWVVNQAARRAPDQMAAVADAGRELFEAQKAALSGNDAGAFEAAQRRQREAIRAVVATARTILEQDGRRPTDGTLERVAATLRAASVEEEGRRLLVAGRLEDDYEGAGMLLLAGVAARETGRPSRGKHAPPRPRHAEQLKAARARVREAKDTARALDRAARDAESAADDARAEAERQEEEARAARARADAAHEAVAEAERAVAELAGPRRGERRDA
jgi:hypothetical protein